MKRMLIYLRFVFLCTIIVSSVVSCTKEDESSGPLPVKVIFNPASLDMSIGDSKGIIATIEPALSDPIKSVITWTSTDKKIASVKNGMITAIAVGDVTVKATTANGIECLCNVKVYAKPILAVGLNIENERVVVDAGKTFALNYEIVPFDANTNKEIIWQSSDEKIATVKDGVITAVSKGSVIIKGSFINGVSAKIELVVKPLPYVISPEMVGTWKCVKLQARSVRTGKIYEEDGMDNLFGIPAGQTMEGWCKGIKDAFILKSTNDNKVIWPVSLRDGTVLDVIGDITNNEDMDNLFFVNYHVDDITVGFGARSASYDKVKVTWLPKTKQVVYDRPAGSFYDFIYTCTIVKDAKVKPVVSMMSLEELSSLKCIE